MARHAQEVAPSTRAHSLAAATYLAPRNVPFLVLVLADALATLPLDLQRRLLQETMAAHTGRHLVVVVFVVRLLLRAVDATHTAVCLHGGRLAVEG